MWHDHIHPAMRSLYPGAVLVEDWIWASGDDGPKMVHWNEAKLGPLDLAAIEAEALRLASVTPVPTSITRRQCARELFERQMITGPEMVAMTATATPPAMIVTLFANMSEAEQWVAKADFAADTYARSNPLLVGIMTTSGATSADIDDFFRAAAAR